MIQHESPNQDKEARSKNLFSEERQLHHFQKGLLSSRKHINSAEKLLKSVIRKPESGIVFKKNSFSCKQGLPTKGRTAQCVYRALPDFSLLHSAVEDSWFIWHWSAISNPSYTSVLEMWSLQGFEKKEPVCSWRDIIFVGTKKSGLVGHGSYLYFQIVLPE